MSFFPGELGTAGVRHAFDLLGMWTHHSGAACVQLVANDESVLRPLQDRLTIPLIAGMAEIALYPFSLEQAQPTFDAPIVAGCFRNIYSYRRLMHPSLAAYSIPRLTADLRRQGYRLEKLVGVYPPAFSFWWTLSVAAGQAFVFRPNTSNGNRSP
jgi:hypothetical protein